MPREFVAWVATWYTEHSIRTVWIYWTNAEVTKHNIPPFDDLSKNPYDVHNGS